ncbi:MAG: polymer-forming cytoskeletal protein [Acidobacteriaceae bacterium]|nr:polymer-forming cytoskeletal protein [Acidobacteriaceae bacterium]
MWSERKQDDAARPDASANSVSRRPAQSRNVAVIGKGMVIRGQIRSAEDIHVDGEIDGTLHLPGFDLTIGPQGIVRADVSAQEVDVAGVIHGNVDATRKISVRKGGRLLGDLRTPGIVIEDGAYFKGKIEIVNSAMRDEMEAVAPRKVVAGA